jgi:hypothetical protein
VVQPNHFLKISVVDNQPLASGGLVFFRTRVIGTASRDCGTGDGTLSRSDLVTVAVRLQPTGRKSRQAFASRSDA